MTQRRWDEIAYRASQGLAEALFIMLVGGGLMFAVLVIVLASL